MADLFESLGLGVKSAQENVVYYALYPDQQPAGDAELLALRARCLQVIEPVLSGGYIWQLEPFSLALSTHSTPPWAQQSAKGRQAKVAAAAVGQDKQTKQPQCVWGSLRWGDNVEDEWMVVGLLRMCTATIPNISAQVWDSDGEFLLIEAAYALPRWLRPDTANHRVWLRGGMLHIIPQPSPKAPNVPAFPTLAQSIQILASGQVRTVASKPDALIQQRLEGFPQASLAAGLHRAKAVLPVRVAAVLQQDAQLVAAAVDAFFYRDADEMKAAARMSHFPPSEERVTVVVATNRCQYAQLAQQRFASPKGWPLPPPGHPLAAAAERGLKLTAGFEILMSRAEKMRLAVGAASQHAAAPATATDKGQVGGSQPGTAVSVDSQQAAEARTVVTEQQVSGHPLWPEYKARLQACGYFQGEMEGSQKYRQLLSTAVQDFSRAVCQRGTADTAAPAAMVVGCGGASSSAAEVPKRLVQLLMETEHVTAEELERGPNGANAKEHDDSWMEQMASLLDQELGRREAESKKHEGKRSRTAHVDAAEVANAMHGFVEHARAGLEGAEVPGEDAAFNASLFLSQLQQVLGMEQPAGQQRHHVTGRHQHAAQRPSHGRANDQTEDAGEEDEDDDEWETTDGEGSSFFTESEEEEEEDGEEEELEEMAGVQKPLHLLDTTPAFSSAPDTRSVLVDSTSATAASTNLHRKQVARRPGPGMQPGAEQQQGSKQTSQAVPWPARPGLAALQEQWEVFTATDSDDGDSEEGETGSEGGDGEVSEDGGYGAGLASSNARQQARGSDMAAFMDAYSRVLEQQLADTTLVDTVERAPAELGSQPREQTGAAASQESGAALKPLDLDFNLVRNLLRSVSSQQGLPGPASNLAGLLGVHLPHGDSDA